MERVLICPVKEVLKPIPPLVLVAVTLMSIVWIRSASAQPEPSIDRLLRKLPPPEKFVKPPAQRQTQAPDPVLADPISKKTIAAVNARNFPRALNLSRQLVKRFPQSATAHGLHGSLALALRSFAEASVAFRAATALQPKFSLAYFGLGIAEAEQGRFAVALQNFQQLTRLEPKAEIGWIASSGCAEQLGRRQESLSYAKRATDMAPKSAAAWMQLARAERALGHKAAAQRALNRAQNLAPARSISAQLRS